MNTKKREEDRRMKQFIYFEIQDGGMEEHLISNETDFCNLYGWMEKDCQENDLKMIEWMKTCEIGERLNHRLGCLVRLKDV